MTDAKLWRIITIINNVLEYWVRVIFYIILCWYVTHSHAVCGGTLFHAKGFILSPSYPQPMAPNVSCDWSIAAPEGGALKLQFLDVHLPGNVTFFINCNNVPLRIILITTRYYHLWIYYGWHKIILEANWNVFLVAWKKML